MKDEKFDETVDEIGTSDGSEVATENTEIASDRKRQIIKHVTVWLTVIGLFLVFNVVIRSVTASRNAASYQPGSYTSGQPVSNGSGGSGSALGNCGGTCCTTGQGGQVVGSGQVPGSSQAVDNNSTQLEKLAIDWYTKNYGDSDVTAEVQDFGCHKQITIKKDGKAVKELSYRGGQFEVLTQ